MRRIFLGAATATTIFALAGTARAICVMGIGSCDELTRERAATLLPQIVALPKETQLIQLGRFSASGGFQSAEADEAIKEYQPYSVQMTMQTVWSKE